MKVIVNGRQAGKTYALVQWVKEGEKTNSYPGWSRIILSHTLGDADRLRKDYGLDYHQVFSVAEWQEARRDPRSVELGVDNVDLVLYALLGRIPSLITVTGLTE